MAEQTKFLEASPGNKSSLRLMAFMVLLAAMVLLVAAVVMSYLGKVLTLSDSVLYAICLLLVFAFQSKLASQYIGAWLSAKGINPPTSMTATATVTKTEEIKTQNT